MKKIYLTLAILLIACVSYAQLPQLLIDGEDVSGQTLVVSTQEVNPDEELQQALQVVNPTGEELSIGLRLNPIQAVENSLLYFCYGQCYSPGLMLLPLENALPIPANGSHEFSAHYMSLGNIGTCETQFVFFNRAGDSTWVTIKFSVGLTGIEDYQKVETSIFPNPVSSTATISYAGISNSFRKGSLVVYSYTGAKVKEYVIAASENSISVNAADFRSGMYLYSVVLDGKIVATNKMVIL